MRGREPGAEMEVGEPTELSFLGMQVACAARKWRKRRAIALAAFAFMLANVVGASAEPEPGLFASPADLPAAAGTAPSLGTAQTFAVLGGSAVTNTGPTTINGNVGLSPGSAVTGFPPGLVTGGTIHAADAVALQAQNDVVTAYNALFAQPCTGNLTGQDLGGKTLIPGVYCFPSTAAQLTGTLVLDAQATAPPCSYFRLVARSQPRATRRFV